MKINIILENKIEFYRIESNWFANLLILKEMVAGRGFEPLTFRL
jgi:hypothetical protein